MIPAQSVSGVRTPKSLRVSGKLPRLAIYAAIVQGQSVFIYLCGWFALMTGDCFREANRAVKPSVTGKLAPRDQVPDFRAFVTVGSNLAAPTVGTVTDDTLATTRRVFNLITDRASDVPLPATLQSGVTFQSTIPPPERNGQQLAFHAVLFPPSSLHAADAEGAAEC